MRHRKADLELAKRQVVDAEKRVAKQRLLVDELERDGYSAIRLANLCEPRNSVGKLTTCKQAPDSSLLSRNL